MKIEVLNEEIEHYEEQITGIELMDNPNEYFLTALVVYKEILEVIKCLKANLIQ